jgi:hypothetical protein
VLTTSQGSELILSRLFQIQSLEDIRQIIESVPGAQWFPLGGRDNNFSTVHVGSDPGIALCERVTNGIDSLIERAMPSTGVSGIDSPRKAVEALFSIPNGRLANLGDDEHRRRLANNLKVTLRESGIRSKPTVVVEDRGIGQHPDDFPRTLLSLQESNKVSHPELLGAYGQGGSSTFAFTPAAIFISRRDPQRLKPGQQDEVGWTVVRFNELDENFKHGRFEYLALPGEYGQPRIL